MIFTHPSPKRRTFRSIYYAVLVLVGAAVTACSHRSDLSISVDTDQIEMGRSVRVQAKYTPAAGDTNRVMLMPYVNGKRWGSHEFPDSMGNALFLLPLPNPGLAQIDVAVVPCDTTLWCGLKDYTPYLTGQRAQDKDKRSNLVSVEVTSRTIPERPKGTTTFVSQWEPWFMPGSMWTTAQAVPLLGFYDFTNQDVLRQHLLWLMDSGADAVLFDWSNHIWGCKHWSERSDGVNAIIHNTEIALEVMASMRDEGLPVPQAIIMPGLSNGPPGTMEALNEELDWIYHYFIRNPRFKGLWYEFDGKPLAVILDTGAMGVKEGTTESAFRVPLFKMTLGWSAEEIDRLRQSNPPVDDSRFTIRWMSSQNQKTGHDKLGYWSWMDGSLKPTVTYKDGVAECTTVNPACFAETGWTAPEAWGRRDGWTYLESFKVALEHRPKVVMLHQFNEFTGQATKGYGPDGNIFADSYSVELSDDYEPVSLTAPGFRGDDGGWGFYYLNLTRALVDIYNGAADDVTLMAVAPPHIANDKLSVHWTTIGVEPENYTLSIDGTIVADSVTETGMSLPVEGLAAGEHTLTVTANGVGTRYALSPYEFDTPMTELKPVVIEKQFVIP